MSFQNFEQELLFRTLSKVVSLGWHRAVPIRGSARPGEAAGIPTLVLQTPGMFLPQKQRLLEKATSTKAKCSTAQPLPQGQKTHGTVVTHDA